MAVSDEEVRAWLAFNPNATDAQIVEAAKKAGVGAEQVSRATQTPLEQVSSRVANVLNPPAPITPTGGMLGGSSIDLTQPSPVSVQPTMFSTDTTGPTFQKTGPTLSMATNVDLTQPSPVSVSTEPSTQTATIQYEDPFEQAVFDIYRNTTRDILDKQNVELYGGMFKEDVESGLDPSEAAGKYVNLAIQSPAYIENSVSSIYSNVFDRPADEATKTALIEQTQNLINSGVPLSQALQDIGELVTANKRTEDLFNTVKSEDPLESVKGLRDLFYGSLVSGQPLGAGTVEELIGPQDVSQRFDPSLQDPFTRSLVAYVNAEGLGRLNDAIEQGDTETAQRLSKELEDPFSFYEQNVNGRDVARNIRSEVVGEDLFYGGRNPRGGWLQREISSFGRSVGSFFENPIDALDRWKDRPLNQFIVSAINPAAGALLSAYSTLDNSGELSPMQIIALVANAPGIAELGQAGFTAAGGGEFGAGFLTEQSLTNAAQNFGVTSPDALQGIVQAGEKLNQAYNVITEPVTTVANKIIGNLGGKEALIAAAGDGAAGRIDEGLRSGATAALIAEATGENPAIAFIKELQGDIPIETFIPDVPESIKNFVAGVGDAISDIPLPDLEFVGDWVEENITLQVNTDLFDGIRGLGFTDALSSIDAWVEDNVDLSGIEDFLKESGDAIGDTVKQIVEAVPEVDLPEVDLPEVALPEVDLPSMDLPDVSLPGVVPMEELAGSDFTAKKGRQGGLAVDTDFLPEEPSLALAILEGRVA